MNIRIPLTILHDIFIFCISFFISLWLRLEFDQAYYLFSQIWIYSIVFAIMNIVLLNFYGLYHGIWRYASTHEMVSILKSITISTLIIIALLFLIMRLENIPRSFPVLLFIISIFGAISPRLVYRVIKDNLKKDSLKKISTIIVGDSSSAENFARYTKIDRNSPYKIIGIISMSNKSVGRRIHNIPIIGSLEKFNNFETMYINKTKKIPERIIIVNQNIKKELIEIIYIFAKKNGLAIGQANKVFNLSLNEKIFDTSPIVIEDVLGRKQNVNDTSNLKDIMNKTILVTGAGGTIGSELCRQIISLTPKKLIVLDNNEYALFKITQELKGKCIESLTDIRDEKKLTKILEIYKPDYVFHAAALKHITFVENDPLEALKTNFLSTVSLCELCIKQKVEKMIFISTDKAVYPSNIMGATKRLSEKYIQEISNKSIACSFSIVRFGNVLGSTGSVVPIFEEQIKNSGTITITHPKVQRYFMTIREAVELVIIASQIKSRKNGEIYILEMGKPVLIKDLAKKMITLSGKNLDEVKIKITGLRKGEKISEDLYFKEEKIKKTDINGILCATEYPFVSNLLKFNKLISRIKNNSIEHPLNDIMKLLPEFKKIKDEKK